MAAQAHIAAQHSPAPFILQPTRKFSSGPQGYRLTELPFPVNFTVFAPSDHRNQITDQRSNLTYGAEILSWSQNHHG
jgi:hypothetical protein